jgi:hypothetical protein
MPKKRAKAWSEGYKVGYAEAWRAAIAWGVVQIQPPKRRKRGKRARAKGA